MNPINTSISSGPLQPPVLTQVLSKRNGRAIALTLTLALPSYWPSEHVPARVELRAFGVFVRLEEKEGLPCLSLNAQDVAASSAGAFFGKVLSPKKGVLVVLEAGSHAALVDLLAQTLAPFTAERAAYRAALSAEREAAPKRYFYEHGIEYGDYSTETIARLVVYRPITLLERAEGRQASGGHWLRHAVLATGLAPTILEPGVSGIDLSSRPITVEPTIWAAHPLREISADEAARLVEATNQASALRQEKEVAEAALREHTAQLQRQSEAARRVLVEANEVLLFDAGTVYSSAGNEMLHALGGRVSEKDGYVSVYTTQHARQIPGDTSTYALRNELLAAGYAFDAPSKEWRIAYSAENAEKTVDFLRTHGRRAWPADLGMGRCWECGCYSKHLDSDGYCGC